MCFLRLGDKINNKLGAMNKLTNIVHSGWITKSPPEQKLQAPLKFLRAKWKERFFVLHKPSGSLPDHYELSYYNSEQCTKKKGSIDLDQCEQIIESLDSEQYPFLLAIKTVCRGKVRTYYLATKTEDDMSNWVQCLCRVCGLKQEDTPTDIPDGRLSMVSPLGGASASTIPVVVTGKQKTSTDSLPVVSQPPASDLHSSSSSSSRSATQPPLTVSTSPQSYVYLNECTTGTPKHGDYQRTASIDSMPEYQAPPPPQKTGRSILSSNATTISSSKSSLDDCVFDGQDGHPHPRASAGNDIYDHPPTGGVHNNVGFSHAGLDHDVLPAGKGFHDLSASVPLPVRRSPRSNRSSFSDRPESTDSVGGLCSESYDVPPPRRSSGPSHEVNSPPASVLTPPQRPPKPHGVSQAHYQNVSGKSPASRNILDSVPSAPTSSGHISSYDIPRSVTIAPPRDSGGLDLVPPPPRHVPSTAVSHSYLNTVPGVSVPHGPAGDAVPKRVGDSGKGVSPDLMDRVPVARETAYIDSSPQDLYKSPPVRPARGDTMPRAPASVAWGASAPGTGVDAEQFIWSTIRTKSFKRNTDISRSPRPARPPPVEPRRPPPRSTGFASSSDDDDDVSIDGNNTHHDISVVRMTSVPAAPERDMEPELKYLDLALEHPEPGRVQASAHVHGSQTEYREIDFVKTKALEDVKKVRGVQRK